MDQYDTSLASHSKLVLVLKGSSWQEAVPTDGPRLPLDALGLP